jgi:hypothetical protein
MKIKIQINLNQYLLIKISEIKFINLKMLKQKIQETLLKKF